MDEFDEMSEDNIDDFIEDESEERFNVSIDELEKKDLIRKE